MQNNIKILDEEILIIDSKNLDNVKENLYGYVFRDSKFIFNTDELNVNDIGIFDIVFALAIEAHVNNREYLLQLLSKITKETLYFEGNSKCEIENISQKLKEYGFHEIEQLGFCNDDINPKNNTRPMLVARKNKKTHKTINILGIKITV